MSDDRTEQVAIGTTGSVSQDARRQEIYRLHWRIAAKVMWCLCHEIATSIDNTRWWQFGRRNRRREIVKLGEAFARVFEERGER